MVQVVTIGAYGWDKASFFEALVRERVGTFCDLRRRRGVRGAEYAFVNSARLQARLCELGIGYQHRLELAPSAALRRAQAEADAHAGVAKRDRAQLGSAFEAAYVEDCLSDFDAERFLSDVGAPVCLFCVEREPRACHRSLVADRLARLGATVEHLLP